MKKLLAVAFIMIVGAMTFITSPAEASANYRRGYYGRGYYGANYARSYYRNYPLHRGGFYGRSFYGRRYPYARFYAPFSYANRYFSGSYSGYPGYFYPRNIYIVDRDYPDNIYGITNYMTGPYSVNSAYVTVDHDSYNRFSGLDLDQGDIQINIDTGNNELKLDTDAGDYSTGDIEINIEQ